MRIYLAAPTFVSRATAHKDEFSLSVARLLASYTSTATSVDRAVRRAVPRKDFCVDSGAHVFLSRFFKTGNADPLARVEKHLSNFVDHIKQLQHKPTFVVELDLQRIYGRDVIDAWRRDVWIPFEQHTGIRVAYVHHPGDSWQEYLDHPDMRHLGMGGNLATLDLQIRAKMALEAYCAGKPIHGFAKVSARQLRVIPYHSVDSTSWSSGIFFGTVPTFNAVNGALRQRAAGRDAFRTEPHIAAARMASTGGKLQLNTLLGTRSVANWAGFLQYAADQYDRMERWYTEYWRAKGVDWDGKLAGQPAFDRTA